MIKITENSMIQPLDKSMYLGDHNFTNIHQYTGLNYLRNYTRSSYATNINLLNIRLCPPFDHGQQRKQNVV